MPHGHSAAVDAILAGAARHAATPPPPVGWSARRRAKRVESRADRSRGSIAAPVSHAATATMVQVRHVGGHGSGSASAVRMLAWGLTAMLALGIAAVATGMVTIGDVPSAATGAAGGGSGPSAGREDRYSYYHDRSYRTDASGAKWDTDRSRSLDPNEAVLGDTSRWEYDGPYRYGPYGSDGMRRRAAGRETRDPLYSQPAPIQDVFSAYGGDLDPSGGQPVGVAPSSMTNPYFDPYAGYSNPYSNRIRLAYGEGTGRGASYDPIG